jgi:hypothetical protein
MFERALLSEARLIGSRALSWCFYFLEARIPSAALSLSHMYAPVLVLP